MLLVHVLKQCGDDLSRENVLRQATNVKDLDLPMFAAGDQDQHLVRPITAPSGNMHLADIQRGQVGSCLARC